MKNLLNFIMILLPGILSANGGPIAESANIRTGNVTLRQEARVQLMNEDLEIVMDTGFFFITVQYDLFNETDAPLTLSYGFPVDYFAEGYTDIFNEPDVSEFRYVLNNQKIPVKRHDTADELNLYDEALNDTLLQDMEVRAYKRSWFLAELTLQPGMNRLMVAYAMKPHYTHWATSKSFFPEFGPMSILYDFTPAGYWGTGKVREFHISVKKAATLQPEKMILFWPALPEIVTETELNYTANNIDISTLGTLRAGFSISRNLTLNYIRRHIIPRSHVVQIKASSQLKGYEAAKAMDGDHNTCWSEASKGNGVGEWIEFQLKDVYFSGVFISNGLDSEEKWYMANHRIRKVKIEVHYKDSNEPQTFEHELKDVKPGGGLNAVYDAGNFIDFGYGAEVVKVRITILEVARGTKYNDTPISEIYIAGMPVRK